MSTQDIVLGCLDEAAKLAAKQNFDHDVFSGGAVVADWLDPDTQASYIEEARDLLLTEGKNYAPRHPNFPHIKYQPQPVPA